MIYSLSITYTPSEFQRQSAHSTDDPLGLSMRMRRPVQFFPTFQFKSHLTHANLGDMHRHGRAPRWRLRAAAMTCFLLVFLSNALHAQNTATQVRVATVVSSQLQDKAEALGTLRANESVVISVNVAETITAIHFEDGEAVNANDVLVEMTSAEEHALLSEAQTNADEAQRQLQRIKQLVASGTASEALLDQRQRDADAAHSRLLATQSRLSDRIVLAPFSGTVGLRNVSVGALVRPGDVITTLTDNSVMKLDFSLPSVYLASAKIGLPIKATASAYPDKVFNGEIRSIDNQVDPVTRAIKLRAIIPNDEKLLKQGLLMQVDLFMNSRQALLLPEQALLPRGEENDVFVAKELDGKLIAEKRSVEIGQRRYGDVEIVSGVSQGERVVTHGGFKLAPGAVLELDSAAPVSQATTQP